MIIQQLSVFLEDKIGRLTEITRILAENDINITALSIADAAEYGIARLVVGRPDLAVQVLKQHNFAVNTSAVICLTVPNVPGGLFKALQLLSDNNVTIDYMYAFAIDNSASVVIRTNSNSEVVKILQANQMTLLKASDIYQI